LAEPAAVSVLAFDAVPSTNDVAFAEGRAHLGELAPLGGVPALAVRAGRQLAGRGRAGRAWESPPGVGLYLSIYLRPAWTPRQAAWLTLAAGLATRAACADAMGGAAPDLKWPNDLLVPAGAGRKLGGILVETRTQGGRIEEAVIGIGVNLAPPPGGFSPALASIAGALDELAPGTPPPAPDALAARILDALAPEIAALDRDADTAARTLVARARAASSLWGRAVRFQLAGTVATGVARTWADDGGLEIALGSGAMVNVHAGDVTVLWDQPVGGVS
jgi:BirA family biotin operon repressor/biotin-[acetyl-CoA-carboxylase] ligase